jgi:ATP-dependent helicase HrpA
VVLEDLDALDLEGYPDWLSHAGEEYALYYRTAPGERDDGVTLGVHIDQLPRLPEWLPGWGVPGDMAWRVEWMIRSLPKDLRRECQPVADAAQRFADEWRHRDPDGPFEVRLAQYLTKFSGYEITPRSFDTERMPEELVTKIWVCDDEERELAFGKDVRALQAKLGKLVTDRFEAAANAEWERRGMKEWTDGEIPERVETPAGPAFPALVDEGSSVGVKAFSNAHEAAESHRAGQVRLLMLAQADQVNYLRKKYPLGLMAKVELPRMGSGMDDLIAVAAEGALGGKRFATPQDFAAKAKEAKGRWFEAASAISKSLDSTFEAVGPVRQWIHDNTKDRHLSAVAADLEEELTWLLRPRFVWRAGFLRMRGHDRYLRGIRSRLGRIASLPLVKDLEKMERVRKYWQPWFIEWTKRPDDPALWHYGWLLEEFRLSLFAPDIPAEMKVSEKRLGEGF